MASRKTNVPHASQAGADQWRPTLIQTKIAPPQTRHLVSRPHLIKLLRPGLERKLSVLVAPAGFGKTTLLTEWYGVLRNEGIAAAWLSLDREDDDLGQFAGYLLASIEKGLAETGKGPRQLVKGDALTSINALLADMLNDLASSGLTITLILDDYDRLASAEIQETVFRLLRYAPDNLHVVLAGRSEPAIPLSYFASRDQLVRLDVEQLRFDSVSTQEFFARVSGIDLDASQADSLIEATEGWVAGLQLASLTIKGRDDAAGLAQRLPRAQRSIDAYLSENVLVHAPSHIQDFLLRTSILDRLSSGLCNAVTGTRDAEASIDWLVARNMFIRPLDEETGWFRYHALFTEYLRNRLAKERPDEVQALHRKASEWYAAQFLWSEAVKHALAAGDIEQATSWVEECAMNQVEISDVRTVLGWVSRLPSDALRSRVRLRLAQAWALALSLHAPEASQVLSEIEADIGNGVIEADHQMLTEMTAVKSLIAGLSDMSAESLDLGRRTLEMQPEPHSWVESIGLTTLVFGLSYASAFDEVERLRRPAGAGEESDPLYSTVYRQSMFGLSFLVEGKLHEAVQTLELAVQKANTRVGRHSAASVLPAGYLATIYYEWNDLAGVASILQNRLETAIEACSLGPLIGFCIGSARMAALNGDPDEAERLIGNAEAIARSRNWLRMEVACKAEAIRLSIRRNDIERAVRAGRALEAAMAGTTACSQGSQLETRQRYETARCRVLIACGRAEDAAHSLQQLAGDLDARRFGYLAAQTKTLLALAWQALGRRNEALHVLAQAVRYGQTNSLVRTFVDEGPVMGELLADLKRLGNAYPGVEAWYLNSLLGHFDSTSSDETVAPPVERVTERLAASRLSAREIEILDHVARGLSNKEIARALRVAPETVKWHLKNIYEKLNVTSRIQAVRSGLGYDLPAA